MCDIKFDLKILEFIYTSMDLLTINCAEPWFSFLEKGIKKVEGRKGLPKYRALKPGDILIFRCADRQFYASVEKVDIFKDLDTYLNTVTLPNALPGIDTLEEGRKIYLNWSTQEDIEKYGFLGIWITTKKFSGSTLESICKLGFDEFSELFLPPFD